LKTKKTSADGEGKKAKNASKSWERPWVHGEGGIENEKTPTDDEGKNKAKTTSKAEKVPNA
jgi:hypothetical protein